MMWKCLPDSLDGYVVVASALAPPTNRHSNVVSNVCVHVDRIESSMDRELHSFNKIRKILLDFSINMV